MGGGTGQEVRGPGPRTACGQVQAVRDGEPGGDRGAGIGPGCAAGRGGAADGDQPLTAPDMIPPTICLPKITKTTSSGRVLISAPAMTMLWSGT